VSYSHQVLHNRIETSIPMLVPVAQSDYGEALASNIGGKSVSKKIAVVALLCAVVALVACRREEYRPLKLGGPVAEQPAR
jgi:hypothetical protein